MAFKSVDVGLEAIYAEIRRRQAEIGRLSLVEFDDAEYATLLSWTRRIVQWGRTDRYARTVFLAFACEFVRRTKYIADNVFWPEFEETLGLWVMEKRFLMMDILWTAYQEEGIKLAYDGRGRRVVGTLIEEVRQAHAWLYQARSQFVEFFQWYYCYSPDEEITPELLAAYREQTGTRLLVLDKVLPALTRDCRALARVIDYAIENRLYLQASRLDDYRRQVIAALGPEYDPSHLRLVRDERTLIRLILKLQNHYTPAQFSHLLQQRRGGSITAPWGESLNVRVALERWMPFPYGIYRLEGQEYRVVPNPRLRLEMLEKWPYEYVVPWQNGRFLGYKKPSPFQVIIGRRTVEAAPYWLSQGERVYVWVGPVPTGEKLVIDDRLQLEAVGADWHVGLKLRYHLGDQPAMCIAIDRLMLYYPERAYQPVRVWSSTGYTYADSLREDGVRRFHCHGALIIPLETFDTSVEVGVDVGDETVLGQTFKPELHYLFSTVSRERVQGRDLTGMGDREYVLFSRATSPPQAGPGVSVRRLQEPYGAYTIYQVTWEDPSQPFDLHVGTEHWAFQHHREFMPLLGSTSPSPYLRLKPHQFHSFADVSLRLYSTSDLIASSLTLEVWDDEGLLAQFNLGNYVQLTNTPNFYDVSEDIWREIGRLTTGRWGRYAFLFLQDEVTLGELRLDLVPPVHLEWDTEAVYPEKEPFLITVTTPHPAWNPTTQRAETRVQLTMRPRTRAEPWPEHPGLRRVASEPVSAPLLFPDLSESVEVVVQPWVFGLHLYLKRYKQAYQPVEQGDYYHLDQTVLYVFAAPEESVEISCGGHLAWTGRTDTNGDLLIADLSFLRGACLDERTEFVVCSGGLKASFIVQWAPLLYDMRVEEETLLVHFHGPENTGLHLYLRDNQGSVRYTWEFACQGREVTVALPIPAHGPGLTYITAEYVLSDGQVRPAAKQILLQVGEAKRLFLSWLKGGIGVERLEHLSGTWP